MKKILITGCYHSMNSGVMAMAETIVQQFPESQVYIFSSPVYYKKDKLRYSIYENVQLVQVPWLNGQLKNKLKLLLAYFGISLYKSINEIMNNVDVIVDVSGDSISNDYGTKSIFFSVLPIFLKSRKTKYVFAPQTIGPFNSGFQQRLVEKAFKKADAVYLREQESVNKLIGVKINITSVLSDLAFLLKPREIDVCIPNQTIAIGVSSLIKKFGKENTIGMFKAICDQCLNNNYNVLLVNHVSTIQGNDILVAKELKEKFFEEEERVLFFEDNFRASEWKSIIRQCNGIISARMHPVVHALAIGVPALNLSYNHKSIGVVYNRFYPYGNVIDVKSDKLSDTVNKFIESLASINQTDFDNKVVKNKDMILKFIHALKKY